MALRQLGLDSFSELSSLARSPPIQTPSSHTAHSFATASSSLSAATSGSRRSIVRRSLCVLENLPKEFSSLIRSHSTSRRFSSQLQDPRASVDDSVLGMNDIQLRPSLDMKMPCSHADDERPSRRTKLESRIYDFLTRSRSRSRSKQDAEDAISSPNTHSKASKAREPMHREGVSQRTKLPTPTKAANGTKPASRIPSRPLSSTTTATNSTVTPSTPKARKRPPSALPIPPPVPVQVQENAPSPSSRPTTPKQSATKKLQNLFSIPQALRRSSRSRSRSRPNSPQPSLNAPPPLPGYDDDTTPKPRKSTNSPHPSRPASPTPKVKPRPSDGTLPIVLAGSTSNSLRLPKLFSGRTTTATISGANSLQPRLSNAAAATGSSKSNTAAVSSPLKRPSSSNRRASLKPEGKPDPPVSPRATASRLPAPTANGKPAATLKPLPAQPTPTPLRGSAPIPLESKVPTPSKGRLETQHHVAKNASLDASYRYRGGNMSIVDEEGRNSLEMSKTTSLKGKARESEAQSHLRTGATKMSATVRNTKHGSFDFERPGWGATIIQRSGSSGTTATMASTHSKEVERESGIGPGLAGVGTLQRDMSMRRAKDTEEGIKARERAKRLQEYVQKDKLPPALLNGHGSSSNHSDHLNASTSTNGTAHTAKSSSLSKATGKRCLAGSRAGGSGAGVARLIGTAQHGLFSFESPVPSPTRSTTSNGAAPENGQSYGGRSEKGGGRLKEEKLKARESEKRQTLKGDRPPVPVPVPSPSSIPQRPGHRGRSLDLGIGLAWAPSKMKETALLPSTTLFSRTGSNASSLGRSASGSTMARSASSSTNGQEGSSRSRRIHIQDSAPDAERSKLGKEVAELFRNVLDDRSYSSFKAYVRQFDAHEIPFDGPLGIVERVERLLRNAPDHGQDNRVLLDKFVRIILQNA